MNIVDYPLACFRKKHIVAALSVAEATATDRLAIDLTEHGVAVDTRQLNNKDWVGRWTLMKRAKDSWPTKQRSALQHYLSVMLSNWEWRQRQKGMKE